MVGGVWLESPTCTSVSRCCPSISSASVGLSGLPVVPHVVNIVICFSSPGDYHTSSRHHCTETHPPSSRHTLLTSIVLQRERGRLAWPGLAWLTTVAPLSSLPPPPRPFCQILKGTPAGMKEREFYCNQCSSQDQSDAEDIVGLAASSRCLNSDCNKSGYG